METAGDDKMSNESRDDELLRRTIEKWGVTMQVVIAMEECGELVAALSHYFFRGRISRETVAQEIADVEIVCAQLRIMVGAEIVDKAKKEKLDRLEEKLKGGSK